MLFDTRPKCSREELFDREQELEKLRQAHLKGTPITVLTGIRRIGKTSLLCVFLNELKAPYILIDARALPVNYGLRDLYTLLSRGMSNQRFISKTRHILERIRGIRIVGFEVEIAWRGRDHIPLAMLLDYLDREKTVIAVDEAQKLRGPRGREFLEALAHAYDYDRNLTFILTGSEVGLLYDYLGIDDPGSPLYGRYINEIRIERFPRDKSIEFLQKGFKEAGVNLPRRYIESIVGLFDGVPGWLTLAGNIVVSKGREVSLDILREQAVQIAIAELNNVTAMYGERTRKVLRLLATGHNTWSKIKKRLEEIEGRTVSKSSLSRSIHVLEKLSIIRDYEFLDPIYEEAARKL